MNLTNFKKFRGLISYSKMQDAMDELIIAGNIILASGNQKYPMSQTTWFTSSHMAYFTMSWKIKVLRLHTYVCIAH